MEPFIGQIMMFGGNFAPRGWAFCDGQLLSISQNSALFSILGTTYGGDGRTTFGLPDLRSRVPVHAGTGPGLSNRRLGAKGGNETETLTTNQIPAHSHSATLHAKSGQPDESTPGAENVLGLLTNDTEGYTEVGTGESADISMHPDAVTVANSGGSQAHNNMPPFQAVNFIIALVGIFPSRN